jgi:hypothetical protein
VVWASPIQQQRLPQRELGRRKEVKNSTVWRERRRDRRKDLIIKIIGREYVHTYILGVEYYLYYDMYLEGKGK